MPENRRVNPQAAEHSPGEFFSADHRVATPLPLLLPSDPRRVEDPAFALFFKPLGLTP
jgi:hypothetical protein